ncbi:MAG: hypothetical protein ACJ758_06040 [Actinomycetota bacterium]|jgi:hypothetical protein
MASAIAYGVFGIACILIAVVGILISTRRGSKQRRSPNMRRPPNPPFMPPY